MSFSSEHFLIHTKSEGARQPGWPRARSNAGHCAHFSNHEGLDQSEPPLFRIIHWMKISPQPNHAAVQDPHPTAWRSDQDSAARL
jgi:hypothetical protein